MGMTGDLKKIALLKASIRELAGVRSRVASPVAARITRRLQAQFDNRTDAYGKPLLPNAPSTIKKKGFDHPMTETGESREKTRAIPLHGTGIGLVTTEKVERNMVAHDNVPARPMLPLYGLPATWRADIKDEVERDVSRVKGKVK